MAKSDIWMPIYVGDYLADTMHLTTEQHGAYFLILLYGWRSGGKIPSDDITLSAISKLSEEVWKKNRAVISGFFSDLGEYWIQKRQIEEIKKAQGRREAAKSNGFKGGRPKINPPNNLPVISGFDSANPPCNPEKSSSQLSSDQEIKISARGNGQPETNRAMEIAAIYPAKSKDGGRPISFPLVAINLLASKIRKDPEYPWEEHASLMSLVPMPVDGLKWVEGLPNPIDLSKLRQSLPKPKSTAYAPRF